ncbi:MAG: tRNA (adenosine(37)-N6)-threonylcarbamoyltransferase complex dimerization subunit type 1 TsaB [Gloeomargarita sp. SKYG116]|nr:tRNA (adenosine(37)-N6)-threonylcarbamoyltransferase complex dimerization subunit type 1 TsaB [Gloeomargarita sp. SKYG116]MCS7226867.1 tRNA (adenosine(37)-N6)-threonylcarbamoyltransferase complex dimerization subunit type 1 TsaB [Gloeomargarita sp. SKYB31]MDW8401925.1 tRNA (adenosine(37)-N6)-threonylcarbamoyltransferase complex dimerization subunit type 1 TsaB [Gloeomargarita sp. SKYGB_i_bin116]
MRLALGLHTAGSVIGIAVGSWETQTWQERYITGGDALQQFHTELAVLMQPYDWSAVDWIAVTRGPGSFTTVRLGLVTARTLAQELNIPLFALSTLGVASFLTLEPVAVSWPAGMDLVYGGIYHRGIALQPDQVYTRSDWQRLLQQWPPPLQVMEDVHTQAPVRALLTWATELWRQGQRPPWSQALPFYGRSPVEKA